MADAMISNEDPCLVDSGTTNTILKSKKYFSQLHLGENNIHTISGTSNLIEGSGRACILLPEGTKLIIDDALYSSRSRRNLLSFKDIRKNGYHIETMNEKNCEYLHITSIKNGQKIIIEKMQAMSSGLYSTYISKIESNMVANPKLAITNQKLVDSKLFTLWHDRLGHPENIMMRRIIESANGHPLKDLKILLSKN